MAETPAALLECLNPRGNGVRVEFHRIDDRFSHTIFGVRGDEAQSLLVSSESSADEVFPRSPPWAEIHSQDDTLFLTGATSQAHWSMSVQSACLTEEDLSSRLFDQRYGLNEQPKIQKECHFLEFDIACRLKSHPTCLGSVYQRSDAVQVIPFGSGREIFSLTLNKSIAVILGSISLEQTKNCRVMTESGGFDPTQLRIGPWDELAGSYPTTVRWKYGICWALD